MDLELFMQRFVHRKDYYAVQRVGKGRCYYQPQKNLCPNVVKQHLKGQRTIGCYAGADSTTKWLVVDIDTKDLSELRAVQDRFDSLKLPYLLEFSGSKGFHLWTFFTEPVSNALARRVGKLVCGTHELFPKQDCVGQGFGNLIKLPLGIHQGSGKRCELLDPSSLKVLKDPWQALRGFSLVSPEELRIRAPPQARKPQGLPPFSKEKMPELLRQGLSRGVAEGRRNRTAFLLGVALLQSGHDHEGTVRALRLWNTRNCPPLEFRELALVIQSVRRGDYKVSFKRLKQELQL